MNTLDTTAGKQGEQGEAEGLRILVVEDEPEHQLLVRKALAREGSGFSLIQFARDSEEAVRYARQMAFDVMLVDNRIPGTRGLDLLTELREVGVDAPFVLMTSAGSEDLVVEAMRQKVAEYVIKDSGFWRDLPSVLKRVVATDQQRRREVDLLGRLERTNARLDQLRSDMSDKALKLAGLLSEARDVLAALGPRLTGAPESERLTALLDEMSTLVE
ncbi:MAG TPA: response regulator [Myxococcota bacterium]|nr:response regulator [Myxococcota bacterium]